jgi:hypothetical protein
MDLWGIFKTQTTIGRVDTGRQVSKLNGVALARDDSTLDHIMGQPGSNMG